MSSREIMQAQGFGSYDKNQIAKAKKRKLKRIKKSTTKKVFEPKTGQVVKNYWPEGTDIQELSKNFVKEYKEEIEWKKRMKSIYMNQDEYFALANKHSKKNCNYRKDSDIW